jgi:WD40 repeat protein
LKYSLDGEYLASGSADGSIRIWHAESFHTKSSRTQIERPTRTPKQADTILVGSDLSSTALSFSRTDSNLLAAGGSNGVIKLWNVKEQACIHTFDSGVGRIYSLLFAGGTDIACIALAGTSVIRIWKPEGSADFASETMGEIDLGNTHPYRGSAALSFSPSGSFLVTILSSRTLAFYDLESMTKTQYVVMPGFKANCVAVSPDSKQLVVGGEDASIRLIQTDDFSMQQALEGSATRVLPAVLSVAFDPTCRFLAVGCHDGRLEIRNL